MVEAQPTGTQKYQNIYSFAVKTYLILFEHKL